MRVLLCVQRKKHLPKQIDKCLIFTVGVAGFELATPCSQSRYTNRTVLHPEIGCKSTTIFRLYKELSGFFALPHDSRENCVNLQSNISNENILCTEATHAANSGWPT